MYTLPQVIWLENVPYEAEAASVVAYIQGALEVTLPHIIKARDKTEMLLEKFQLVNAEWQDAEKQVRAFSLLSVGFRVWLKGCTAVHFCVWPFSYCSAKSTTLKRVNFSFLFLVYAANLLYQPAKDEIEASFKKEKCRELKAIADRAEERWNLAKEHTEGLVCDSNTHGLCYSIEALSGLDHSCLFLAHYSQGLYF